MRLPFGRFESRVARRIFLELVLVLFAPLALLAYLGLDQASRQLERQAMTHLQRSAKDAAMSLIARLQACEMNLEIWLGDYASSGTLATRSAPTRLAERLAFDFRAMTLALPQGNRSVLGPPLELPQLEPGEREHLAQGQLLLHVLPGAQPRLLALVELEGLGLGAGVLLAEIEPQRLLPVEGTQGLSLLRGNQLLHSTDPDLFTELMLREGISATRAPAAIDCEHGVQLVVSRRVFLRPQYGLDLTLVVAQPEAQASAAVADFRLLFALSALLGFLGVLLVGLKRIQKNLEPIAVLHEATQRVAAGNLDARVAIRSRDEFQDLGEAFNGMAERVHQRTNELVEANAAKTRFLANVSHEIRTPMNAILGYTDLCLGPGGEAADLRENLKTIRASGQHLLRLINDLLDVSRIEAGRLEIRPRPCSAARVLREAVHMVQPQIETRGLELRIELHPQLPQQIRSDPDRLRQVLVNLLSNAAKFTREGHIAVRVDLRQEASGPRLVFEVADTGPGIEPRLQERLFEPFVQGDTSLARVHGGAGLGLSIARALVRLLGGDLTCRSEPGRGATFLATIDPGPPLAAAVAEPEQPNPSPALPGPDPAGQRLLLVEDVAVNRLLVRRYLTGAGYTVDEAVDGRQALEKTLAAWREGRPYALVLMDIQMPEMSGFEATRALRARGYDGAIVALTAHAIEGERERCLEAGCDDFVTKPIERAHLLGSVPGWLRRPRSDAAA